MLVFLTFSKNVFFLIFKCLKNNLEFAYMCKRIVFHNSFIEGGQHITNVVTEH